MRYPKLKAMTIHNRPSHKNIPRCLLDQFNNLHHTEEKYGNRFHKDKMRNLDFLKAHLHKCGLAHFEAMRECHSTIHVD